jgi:hypothetical protein
MWKTDIRHEKSSIHRLETGYRLSKCSGREISRSQSYFVIEGDTAISAAVNVASGDFQLRFAVHV